MSGFFIFVVFIISYVYIVCTDHGSWYATFLVVRFVCLFFFFFPLLGRWATLVHRDAMAKQAAVAWTACAASVAMMAMGQTRHGARVLARARADGLLGAGGDGEYDTLK